MTNEHARGNDSGEPGGSRAIPHNLAAEASILGAALLKAEALEVLATKLRPEDFYKPANGHVASALIELYEAGLPADPVTVAEILRRKKLLDHVGGASELISLQAGTPSTTNASSYAVIVHDHATLRRLISSAGKISDLAYNVPEDVHDAVIRATGLLGDVAANNGQRTYSSLIAADVAGILNGDLDPELPSFLTRTDGRALLYAGRMHVIQAEPSVGKTFFVLFAVLEILALGGSVIYVDYEDTAKGIVGRLLAMGADPAMISASFHYVSFDGAIGAPELLELDRMLETLNPDLVVIDGVAESLARDGYDEDKARDVVEWTEKLPRKVARTGAAVVMLDHLAKDKEKRGRQARGSGHKLAAVDGATYELRSTRAFSRTSAGSFRVICSKDRHGSFAVGEEVGVVEIEPHADGARVVVTLNPPGTLVLPSPQKPTFVMALISQAIEEATVPLSASTLRNLLPKQKPKTVDSALAHLKAEGFVIDEAKGRMKVLRNVKPYHRDTDPPPPTEPPAGLFDESLAESDPENYDI